MRKLVLMGLGLGILGAVYWYVSKPAPDNTDQTPTDNTEPSIFEDTMSTVINTFASVNADALNDGNVQAFLTLIRTGEGTLGAAGYRTLFGGSLFESFADHPRIKIRRNGITSTAAGAYQFLAGTWDEMQAKYDLPDFTSDSQDIACIGLIKRRGALADVIGGRFKTAIDKCNKEWASLPGSPYGQPTLTYARAQNVLAQSGANLEQGFI
jgi:muramidase (phage lysozyme)